MAKLFQNIPPKLRLYLPIMLGIILSISLITVYSVSKLKSNMHAAVERNLSQQVETLKKMFERERTLKLDKVKNDLKVANKLFYQGNFERGQNMKLIRVTNQMTGNSFMTAINNWRHRGNSLYNNFEFVDEVNDLVGGTSTVFQKIDSGYVRISTNVRKSDGSRAIGTFIPNDSPVVETIEQGETYIGRAYVVNNWYITAYEPIYQGRRIIGMLYVGDLEKDLEVLRRKINGLLIGKSGFPFVIDEEGNYVVHPNMENGEIDDRAVIDTILSSEKGIATLPALTGKQKRVVAWDYFPEFRLYIAAEVPLAEETGALVREVIINSAIIALVIILAFSIFVYFITTENVRKFLNQLEYSSKKLRSTEKALQQSEQHFRTLFNNSSDEIFVIDFDGNFVEVNQVACENLGYSHEEFLKMNARQIKPEHLKSTVDKNISMISKFGQHRYESENMARGGRVVPVEMKSRVIDYKGQQVILTISRDISERKEMEDRILTAIIQTEENERKRFAADLHDDLGPILSTIKLYTDLLKKKKASKMDSEEALKTIEELVDTSIEAARSISRNIKSNILQDFGLAAAVNDFCTFVKKTESINLDVSTSQYKIERRGIEESILYQAVKELINNTLKHADAENIRIELKSFDNQVILYYRDDGKGFNFEEAMKNTTGFGLNNIVNKIKSIKGNVDINTSPGEGMFLIASLRLNKEE
jgi:PAS domain S-box-containing protein